MQISSGDSFLLNIEEEASKVIKVEGSCKDTCMVGFTSRSNTKTPLTMVL